jgi:hypothetical protein
VAQGGRLWTLSSLAAPPARCSAAMAQVPCWLLLFSRLCKIHSSELCGDDILWSMLIHWSNYIEKPAKIIRVTKLFRSPEID